MTNTNWLATSSVPIKNTQAWKYKNKTITSTCDSTNRWKLWWTSEKFLGWNSFLHHFPMLEQKANRLDILQLFNRNLSSMNQSADCFNQSITQKQSTWSCARVKWRSIPISRVNSLGTVPPEDGQHGLHVFRWNDRINSKLETPLSQTVSSLEFFVHDFDGGLKM